MSMTTNVVDEFAQYLTERHINAAALLAKLNSGGRRADDNTLRDLYEASDLSANDFAEEVAAFYRLPRIALPQMICSDANATTRGISILMLICLRGSKSRWEVPHAGTQPEVD